MEKLANLYYYIIDIESTHAIDNGEYTEEVSRQKLRSLVL